jgi:hypothetical protein
MRGVTGAHRGDGRHEQRCIDAVRGVVRHCGVDIGKIDFLGAIPMKRS